MKGTFDEPLRSRQAGGSKTPQRPRDDPKRAPREMPPPLPSSRSSGQTHSQQHRRSGALP